MKPINGVMFQYFQWYSPTNGSLWNELSSNAKTLSEIGITSVWLPPMAKGANGPADVGYGSYDLFDLGEFDQKGAVRTKYGTKEQLLAAIQSLKNNNVGCYGDVVFNHKDGGDEREDCDAEEVDWDNRNNVTSAKKEITCYTKFTFPGRAGKYSTMIWHWWCFDALTYNLRTGNNDRLYRLK